MIRRLVDVDYLRSKSNANDSQKLFWLLELRTFEFLSDLVTSDLIFAKKNQNLRADIIKAAIDKNIDNFQIALKVEEENIRQADTEYWKPLIKELESLRHQKRTKRE